MAIDPKDQNSIEELVTDNEYEVGDTLLDGKYEITKVDLYVRYDMDKRTMQGYTAYEIDKVAMSLWERIKCRLRR